MVSPQSKAVYIDLHVHTRRYSACAETLDPGKLAQYLTDSHLDGIVLAEHDALWPAKEIATLNTELNGKRFFRAVEVSSVNGHFVVIGLDNLNGITPGITIAELTARSAQQGAAVILVHHHQIYSHTADPIAVLQLPPGIDAIETASSVTFGKHQRQAERYAGQRLWSRVGGSDAHYLELVGCSFSVFESMPRNEKEMARAIRQGRVRAMHWYPMDE